MHTTPVDPRSSGWEVDQPAYHVYFWRPPSSVPDAMWTSDEWRLTEADVHEVLAWAEDQAKGRRTGPDGRQCEAAWMRTLRASGDYVYSGCYSTRHRPGADRASVHVAFPLDEGNVQVFLRPDIDHDGSLWLRSPGKGFGTDGAYVVGNDRGRTFAACPRLREEFHVWVDDAPATTSESTDQHGRAPPQTTNPHPRQARRQ
jgi:hypothetical protein